MATHLAAKTEPTANTETERPEIEAPPPNSNSRHATIVNVIQRLAALDEERKSISDTIAAIKQKEIKGDLGMKISDFNVARRLYLLEGDDRRQMLATIKETFDALKIGEQLDFISAMSQAAA